MPDPNGWVTQPPSMLAKVHSIAAKPELNGQIVVVVDFSAAKQRYIVVQCTSQEQLSLKATNLLPANWMEKAQGQLALLRNDPKIRQQFGQIYQRIDAQLPKQPVALKPEHVGILLILLLLAAVWFLGMSKTLLILSLVIILAASVAPDLLDGKALDQIGRDLPQRVIQSTRTAVRDTPVVGNFLARTPYVVPVLLGVLALWTVKLLVTTTPTPASAPQSVPLQDGMNAVGGSTPYLAATTIAVEQKAALEELYKMGFDDATQGLEYGAHLPTEIPAVFAAAAAAVSRAASSTPPLDAEYFDYNAAATTKSSPWNISTLMSLLFLGRTLYALGQDGTGSWNPQSILVNVQHQPSYQNAFLALSIYRVVKAFL